MRKTTLLLTAALLVTIAACIKEKDNVTPQQSDDDNPIDSSKIVQPKDTSKTPSNTITINGMADMPLGTFASRVLNLNVECDSCEGNEIFLSVTGTHPNIETKISKESGFSDFNTTIKTKTAFAKHGTYPIEVTANDRKGRKKVYKQNIIVEKPSKADCNSAFYWGTNNGTFSLKVKSQGGIVKDTVVGNHGNLEINHNEQNLYFSAVLHWNDTLAKRYVTFKDHSQYHLLINFDCNTGKLNIPEQIIKGKIWVSPTTKYFKVKGSGMLDTVNHTYIIEYSATYDSSGTQKTNEFMLTSQLRDL